MEEADLGITDSGVWNDTIDFLSGLDDASSDFEWKDDPLLSPFCDLESTPIPEIAVDQDFVFPVGVRDASDPIWVLLMGEYSSNLIAVVGDEGKERMNSGIWLPFGADLHFRLADYYPYDAPPEIVPEYLAVSVLVDHQSVLADYTWEWKGRDYAIQSFFMSVSHQTTQFLDVKIPASAFPKARTYDVIVLFFKPNARRTQVVRMNRLTLYYGGFGIPDHPCIPLPEEVELTNNEAAYQEFTATQIPREQISVYYEDPAESMEKDSIIQVEMDATIAEMNVLLGGTLLRENHIHDYVPMKIITFIDYVAQEESILIGLPQETRDFVHRDKVEIPLNPGPETVVWMVGVYNPWIPAVSWDNRVNPDIPGLYRAYRSNRIIFRRSE